MLDIIQQNKDIPVVVTNLQDKPINYINLPISKQSFTAKNSNLPDKKIESLFKDSIRKLCQHWAQTHHPFEIEVYKGIKQRFYYYDSKRLGKLERQRDSLIGAFNTELIENQSLLPVLYINQENRTIIETNVDSLRPYLNQKYPLEKKLSNLFADSIKIEFEGYFNGVIYFDESPELKIIKWFPFIQFSVVGLFILIAYIVFRTYRKAEQNQVWAGLAKETAHQLGTPISSLMAWVQLLETQNVAASHLAEMNKDIDRLSLIADRFSKIGSGAQLKVGNIIETIERVMTYLKPRISSQVNLHCIKESNEIVLPHNAALLEWVIENIVKNAVDAMDGKGNLTIQISQQNSAIYIDIADTGKGIPHQRQKTIFEPGFTTKKRGWGLGLSLAKRIVNTYHKGKIFVLKSEIDKGTTFRICLNKK